MITYHLGTHCVQVKKCGGEEAKLMWEIVLICTVTTFNEKSKPWSLFVGCL